jgi:phage terminase large subunit
MLKADGLWDESVWNATDKIYRVNNCEIEFFGADTPGKVMGPARDILFINECINVPFDVYRQLATRTREKVILDYNPLYEFWLDDKVLPSPDRELIHSTYKDNDMLTASQVAEIEYQGSVDENYYCVYILGETGSYEGLVIKNWDIVGDTVKEFKKEYIGLDFGYGAPTAAEHIRLHGGEIWIDEVIYETNLTNPDIARRIKDAGLGHVTIVADSAEPKSIRELQNAGLNVVPADKGDDSVRLGIQVMNRYKKHYTARSLGSIDENRKYHYTQDSNGRYTGKPVDKFNHAKDAERYVFLKYLGDVITEFDYSIIRS